MKILAAIFASVAACATTPATDAPMPMSSALVGASCSVSVPCSSSCERCAYFTNGGKISPNGVCVAKVPKPAGCP